MAEQEILTVEQCDRDAAVAVRRALYRSCAAMPSYPYNLVPPIMAAHRLAATKAADERVREMVWRAYQEGFSDGPGDADDALACWELSAARAALAEEGRIK